MTVEPAHARRTAVALLDALREPSGYSAECKGCGTCMCEGLNGMTRVLQPLHRVVPGDSWISITTTLTAGRGRAGIRGDRSMKKDTICVHSGSAKDPHGGLNTPVYASSATDYRDRADPIYPRYFNAPNQEAVVRKLAALEGAETGLVFSSGMAAICTAVLSFAQAGDHVVLQDECYGGTHAFAEVELKKVGIECTFAATDAEKILAAVTDRTRIILLESPTNPLLSVLDVRAVTGYAREHGIVTVLDNTFASPINQTPVSLGVDIVMHSGTKYLGGHSDLSSGALLTSTSLLDRLRKTAVSFGGNLNAWDCALLERSLKTLALRVARQNENAGAIAAMLDGDSRISRVFYPGLPGNPGHITAARQMTGFGGMLSFELAPALRPQTFVDALNIVQPALSLGGVESTICVPALTSHAKLLPADRERIGISESLLRFSAGIEDPEDLMTDLRAALSAC